jgi:integrase/recombinase XerD
MSDIKSFVSYLRDVKKTSRNTEISYQRDLMQLASFLEDKGITEVEKVTKTSLNSYILFFGKGGKGHDHHIQGTGIHEGFFQFHVQRRTNPQGPGGTPESAQN